MVPALCTFLFLIKKSAKPFLDSWLFGLAYFCVSLSWLYVSMHDVGGMHPALAWFGVIALSAYLALSYGIALKITSQINSKIFLIFSLASALTLTEWLRGWVLTGFPWASLIDTQIDGPFFGWAPILGGLGCLWFLTLTCAYLVHIKQNMITKLFSVILLISISHALQLISFTTPYGRPFEVTLIQGNFPQSLKFNPDYIAEQIKYYQNALQTSKSLLTVAPETSFPINSSQIDLLTKTEWLEMGKKRHILFGIFGTNPNHLYSNSAMGFGPIESDYRYDKSHLVPFGEFIPSGFKWFVDAMVTPLGNQQAGAILQKPFAIKQDSTNIYAGIMICYEDVFGGELAYRQRNSQLPHHLWINMTNLAWFGDGMVLDQHLRLARLRSLETGIPTIRATNTGVTAIIDQQGEVTAQLPVWQQSTLKAEVQAYDGQTPYVRWGNTPIVLISIVVLAIGLIRSKKAPKTSQDR